MQRVKATCGCEVSHFKRLANRTNQDHRLGLRKHLAKPNSRPLPFLTAYCPFTHRPLPTHSAYTSLASGHARQWTQSTLEPRVLAKDHTIILTFVVLSSSSLISRSSGSIDFSRIEREMADTQSLQVFTKYLLANTFVFMVLG